MQILSGVLTVSDRAARGERADESGPLLRELLRTRLPGAEVTHTAIVPDERAQIAATLLAWCEAGLHLIITTGGTGFAPRDVTPEAVRSIVERDAQGLVLAMLQASLLKTPHAMLSRPVAGIRGHTLIITFPGSSRACRENFETILPALPHGLELLNDAAGADQRH
jgi:molybdopterin adenylyltransferase